MAPWPLGEVGGGGGEVDEGGFEGARTERREGRRGDVV